MVFTLRFFLGGEIIGEIKNIPAAHEMEFGGGKLDLVNNDAAQNDMEGAQREGKMMSMQEQMEGQQQLLDGGAGKKVWAYNKGEEPQDPSKPHDALCM